MDITTHTASATAYRPASTQPNYWDAMRGVPRAYMARGNTYYREGFFVDVVALFSHKAHTTRRSQEGYTVGSLTISARGG
jgi:hypothetical protein